MDDESGESMESMEEVPLKELGVQCSQSLWNWRLGCSFYAIVNFFCKLPQFYNTPKKVTFDGLS